MTKMVKVPYQGRDAFFDDLMSDVLTKDMVIYCQGARLRAHRAVLATLSPFLAGLLTEDRPDMNIQIPEVSASAVESFLRLAYVGTALVNTDDMIHMRTLFEILCFNPLMNYNIVEEEGEENPKVELTMKREVVVEQEVEDEWNDSDSRDSTSSVKKKDFTCFICHRHFASSLALSSHTQVSHPGSGHTYRCDVCLQPFSVLKDIYNHRNAAHGQHSCPNCRKLFYQEKSLKRHVATCVPKAKPVPCPEPVPVPVPELPRYRCQVCQCDLANQRALTLHIAGLHGTVSGASPATTRNSGQPMVVIPKPAAAVAAEPLLGEFRFKCLQCFEMYKTEEDLERHRQRKHPEGGIMECKTCQITFTLESEYHKHQVQKHMQERELQCLVCSEEFATRKMTYRHILKHYQFEISVPKEHKCEECGIILASKQELEKHRDEHMPFKCNICEHAFPEIKQLMLHMNTMHNVGSESTSPPMPGQHPLTPGMKRAGAPIGGARVMKTPRSGSLWANSFGAYNPDDDPDDPPIVDLNSIRRRNMASSSNHNTTRDMDQATGLPDCSTFCFVCKLNFPAKEDLAAHSRYHPSNSIYKCDLCPREFLALDLLKEHRYSHSKVKAFKCKQCDCSYYFPQLLKRHELEAHSGRT